MKTLPPDRAIWVAQQVASLHGSTMGIAVAIDGDKWQVSSWGKDTVHCRLAKAECDRIANMLKAGMAENTRPF